MRNLVGKTAFVTGGASGIGYALGRAFAEAGMTVMLADIETDALAGAVESLRGLGPGVRGVACDVTDPKNVEHAAEASYEAFGNVHVVCNTASMAGLNSGLGLSPYSASKFAVVNISEGLAKPVAPLGIGVTMLCPGL
jgi:NAD(P)-dependent dehydrogenase (short-subunit alcohol dehydrogenase family)